MDGIISIVEFNEKLGDFAFLEDQYLGYSPERTEFFENKFVGELKNNSLVNTNQKNFGRTFQIGFSITQGTVGGAIAHNKEIIINDQ